MHDTIAGRLREVLELIRDAEARAGRPAGSTLLVAVSKTHPADSIRQAAQAGQMDFGESYVQESLDKLEILSDLPVRWHFIGHLQTNKAKFVAGRFHLVHGVDSLKLADSLHRKARDRNLTQDILIQVNLAREPQKSGVDEADLPALAEAVAGMDGLRLKGLMLIPPFGDDPEETRPYFARLRETRDALARRLGLELPHLSMGMSGDFIQAVEEGATIVRVGTRIFGERSYAK